MGVKNTALNTNGFAYSSDETQLVIKKILVQKTPA